MNIAFLGLGRMGRVLAAHVGAEHDLTVWNRSPGGAGDLVAAGARLAATPAEAVEGAEVVITALFGPDAVREVVTAGELPLQAGVTWIDITTVAPADTEEFAAWAAGRGVRYAHSPVIGSLVPARMRKLGVLLGGDTEAVKTATPVVSLWADPERLRIYDSPAKAAADKLVNNLTIAVAMQGIVEALRLGHAGGLTSEQVLTALDKSALSAAKDLKLATLRDGSYSDTQFSAALLAKDTRLMTHTSNGPLPAVTAAFASLTAAVADGHGEDDFAVIAAPELAQPLGARSDASTTP
jgi:3-hydroxyisobutyrate dehydrogenase